MSLFVKKEGKMSYFDEQWYLFKYPDVVAAIERGEVESGLAHFQRNGRAEGRLSCDPELSDRIAKANKIVAPRMCHFDRLYVTSAGTGLIIGWIDNRGDSIQTLTFAPYVGNPIPLDRQVLRCYRNDVVEKKPKDEKNYDYGLWVLFDGLADRLPHLGGCIRTEFASGCIGEVELPAQVVPPEDMRGRVLEALGWPTRSPSSPVHLGETIGPILRRLNAEAIANAKVSPPVVHGKRLSAPSLSVVIVLERIDLMLRQAALFAEVSGISDVEFVCVCNRPEMASTFHAMADSAHVLYGLNVVSLSASNHLGLAKANNAAAQIAGAKTLLFLNECVLPGDRDCLERALHVALQIGEKDVVGAQLLTEDNSVHHIGRSFKLADCVHPLWCHYEAQKGMPVCQLSGDALLDVDAVTAAMLVQRSSFLDLGGFDERYLSDEYRDSDYCLRARGEGGRIAVSPSLLFYYLEPGVVFPRPPREWAASMMDRVFFNETWRSTIENSRASASN
jgi:hypothetical protein